MKRREKCLTRRARAVRRLVGLGVVLFVSWQVLHVGYVLPVQAIRQQEQAIGAGATEVVSRFWEPETGGPLNLVYVTANEQIVLFKQVHFTLYTGWEGSQAPVVLDCSGEKPFFAGCGVVQLEVDEGGDPQSRYYFFGRVNDPSIQKIEAVITYEDTGDQPSAQLVLQTDREEWTVLGDAVFFSLRSEPVARLGGGTWTWTAAAYDGAGNLVARQESV